MRVAYVSPQATRGGAERVTMDLIALHDRAAVEPVVFFLSDGPLVAEARSLGVPVEVFRVPRMRNVLAAERAKRTLALRLSARHVDLVHSAMAWGHAYAGAAAALAKIPAVWYQHDTPHWPSAVNVLAALTPARRILANSAYTASAQRRFNPRRIPVDVLYYGTRLPAEPRSVRRGRGRKSLGIGADEFAVGIIARLQRWKGQDVVIRAAASLLRARPNARLFIIGQAAFGLEREYPEELKRLAASLGLADRVVFTGHRDDVADCLAALDLAVHASVAPEPFGLALTEAMAAGTTLIASDAGAVREIVEPGETAVLVQPGDHETLATALLALHDDPERRARLAKAAERVVRSRFDARAWVGNVEETYRKILAR